MNTTLKASAIIPPQPPIRDAEHYRHMFNRCKWYMIVSAVVVFCAAAAFVMLVVRPENPELTAQALIGLEHNDAVVGAKQGGVVSLGREDIMLSRTFLKETARHLSLQLSTTPVSRYELFETVKVDSSAACGTYCVRFDKNKKGEFSVLYYDTTVLSLPLVGFLPGSEATVITSKTWRMDQPFTFTGMSLLFSKQMRANPRDFTFKVVDIRVAVEGVLRNLTIKRATPDKGINYIAVHLVSRDYALSAATVNAIADAFIEKNSGFTQQRTRGVVSSLDKQLRLAQTNLASAETKIRDFRALNPQVGLTQQTQQTVSSLAVLDNGIQNTASDIASAIRLKNEYAKADSNRRLQLAGEIVEMLWARTIPAGKTLSEELNRLLTQQHEITLSYGTEHPLVLENSRAIKKTCLSIATALDEYISTLQSTVSRKQQNVQQLSGRLRQLPALEMQRGELERNQKIYADIYSAVLESYNQAKVADAVEMADFYVMDYAVAPLPPPVDKSQTLILCIVIALFASFAPVLIRDYFDKSVRSQRQLIKVTGSPVLEAIPFFSEVSKPHTAKDTEYHPLINVACEPQFTRELFDSLLLKVNLRMYESTDHSIIISSYESGSGKSTISANLAIAIALRNHRVLLVDGDLRRGRLRETFGLPESAGFSALLAGSSPLPEDDFLKAVVKTDIPNLYVLPAGAEPKNPAALFSSKRMEQFKQFAAKNMAYTIIDTPPIGIVSDAAVVQNLFPHFLYVVRSGKTNVKELVERINEFDQLPSKTLGYVLNCASHDAVGTYRRYSKYYTR